MREVTIFTAELSRLAAQLEADQEELERNAAREERKEQDERRRSALDEEQARLDYLQMTSNLAWENRDDCGALI